MSLLIMHICCESQCSGCVVVSDSCSFFSNNLTDKWTGNNRRERNCSDSPSAGNNCVYTLSVVPGLIFTKKKKKASRGTEEEESEMKCREQEQ